MNSPLTLYLPHDSIVFSLYANPSGRSVVTFHAAPPSCNRNSTVYHQQYRSPPSQIP
jgi:hypothetical protein